MQRVNSAGAGMYKSMSLEDLIKEHQRLVAVLESDSREDDKREAETQRKELEELIAKKKKMEKGKKDYGKLVQKVIYDKRGYAKKVWVDPRKDEPKSKGKTLKEVDAKLFEKVKRKGEGQGKEITLTSDEVKKVLQYGEVGLISAGINPADERDKMLSEKQVDERYGKLKGDLVKKGYTFVRVKGKYGEEEDSFMVMVNDVSKKDIQAMGTAYNQDSIIYSNGNRNELIYTTGDNKHKKHRGGGFKWLKEDVSDYYSEIETDKGKMKFSLNFHWGKLSKAMIEKAFGKKDLSKLVKKTITDSKGNKKVVWVKPDGDDPKKERPKKEEEETKPKQEKEEASDEDKQSYTMTDGDKQRFGKITEKLKGWVEKQKAQYDEENDSSTSADATEDEQRKGIANFLKKKGKAIVKGIKHEIHEWREAGHGIAKFAKGEKLTSHEKKAIRDVAIHMGIVVALAASGGTGAAGATLGSKAAMLGGKIAFGYLEHAGLMRAGHALLFGKGESEVLDILKAIEDSKTDEEAEHNIERLLMSMADYVENYHGKESKKEEDGEKNS